MIEVYVFRHGETDWNAGKRVQGHTDIPLNARGRAQAEALAAVLRAKDLQAIVTSDLVRARETAEIIARLLVIAPPLHSDPRLREIHLGEIEGELVDDITTRIGPVAWDSWRSMHPSHLDFRFTGGESKREALARLRAGLQDFAVANDYQRIGLAAHGAVLRLLVHSLLPPDHEPIHIHNCDAHVIRVPRASDSWEYLGRLEP